MTKEDLISAFNEIDDRYLEEGMEPIENRFSVYSKIVIVLGLAAAVVVCMLITNQIGRNTDRNQGGNNNMVSIKDPESELPKETGGIQNINNGNTSDGMVMESSTSDGGILSDKFSDYYGNYSLVDGNSYIPVSFDDVLCLNGSVSLEMSDNIIRLAVDGKTVFETEPDFEPITKFDNASCYYGFTEQYYTALPEIIRSALEGEHVVFAKNGAGAEAEMVRIVVTRECIYVGIKCGFLIFKRT